MVCGNTVSEHIRTLFAVLHREKRKLCGNTVSTHTRTLFAVLHRETRKCCGNTDNVSMPKPEVSFCLLTPPQLVGSTT